MSCGEVGEETTASFRVMSATDEFWTGDEYQIAFEIEWGDGTGLTETQVGFQAGETYDFVFPHTYSVADTYQVTLVAELSSEAGTSFLLDALEADYSEYIMIDNGACESDVEAPPGSAPAAGSGAAVDDPDVDGVPLQSDRSAGARVGVAAITTVVLLGSSLVALAFSTGRYNTVVSERLD